MASADAGLTGTDLGGFPAMGQPRSAFPGFIASTRLRGRRDPRPPKQMPFAYKGMHGYLPSEPAMLSSLFVEGPAVAQRGYAWQIDMRAIAPSIARIPEVEPGGAAAPSAL